MSEDVEMGVVESEIRAVEVEGIGLTLTTTLSNLRTLFKLRDQFQILLEHLSIFHRIQTHDLLDTAARFFIARGFGEEKLNPPIAPPSTDVMLSPLRTIKINMMVEKERKISLESSMQQIVKFWGEKNPDTKADTYLVLSTIFQFALERKSDLESFLKSSEKSTESQTSPSKPQNCNVCGEHQIVEEFCNATICRQCKSYFALQMRRHRLYTLRCNHPPTLDLTGEIDFSCRCCRLEKCRQVGMIDEFQYQLKSVPKVCSVCHSDADIKLVCASGLCLDCRIFFDNTCQLMYEKNLRENSVNIYKCVNEAETCRIEAKSSKLCSACRWNKIDSLGVIEIYVLKTQGRRNFKLSDNAVDLCAVCFQASEGTDEPWFGQNICQICKAFLSSCMSQHLPRQFCCPDGELDRLCPVPDLRGQRCKFCWFRRMELEGLVDRWVICDGNSSLWLKNFIDLDSGDDDDVQEVYHELPKKKSRKEIGSEMTVVQSDDAEVRKSVSADDYCPPDDVDDDNDVEEIDDYADGDEDF